jgi:hypothetical protein
MGNTFCLRVLIGKERLDCDVLEKAMEKYSPFIGLVISEIRSQFKDIES